MAITMTKLELKVTPTDRNRLLVAHTNECEHAIRQLATLMLERPHKINVFWVTHSTPKPSRS